MTTYGVTDTGFVAKTYEIIKAEVEQDQLDDISSSLDQQADGPLGQENGIFCEALAQLWEALEAVYAAFDPDENGGDAQDGTAALTGVTRLPAAASTVTVLCTGTNATVLDASRQLSVNNDLFSSLAAATLATATAWASGTAYALGAIRTNATRIYYCITAGTSAGAGGPTTTAADITDNTCHWRYVGEGAAYASVAFQADETGTISAPAWTLTEIETPVSGWENAANPLDAVIGRNIETDAELRARREARLVSTGYRAMDAIRDSILDEENATGATACKVFENDSDVTDGDGLPPHSFQAVVLDGDDDLIAQVIWDHKPAGIEPYGTQSGTALDSEGASHTMYFDRPVEKTIYITYDVTTDADFPADGADQIEAAAVAKGDLLSIGDDVVYTAFFSPAYTVAGVVDVTALKMGFSASPSGVANLTIGAREIAVFDTSYVVVNVT